MKQKSYKPVERVLRELSREEPEPFHYERTMANVRDRIKRRNPLKDAMKKTAIISGAAVALFVAMLLIPMSYSVVVGTIVHAEIPVEGVELAKEIIEATMDIDGVVQRKLAVKDGVGELSVAMSTLNARAAIAMVQAALASRVDGITTTNITAEEVREYMGGNALAAVTGGRIAINCENMSADEIKSSIIQQLMAR